MKIRDLIIKLEEFATLCGDDIEVKSFDGDTMEHEPITGFVVSTHPSTRGIDLYTDKD